MRRPDVDYVSVKISALCANLDVLAFDHEVERISSRLETIYEVAASSQPPVFVNLDMEEYRDLHLTVAAFRRVLDEPRFATLPAGIVIQAYLPDSHDVVDDLLAWVAARHRGGGGAGEGPPRQGRQPGDGARRRRARRLGPGAVRDEGRRRRQLQGPARPAPRRRRRRRAHRRRRQPQPVRRGLGARRARPPWARRHGRHRDARGHGTAAVASDAGGRRRAAALHTGGHRRGLRGEHRLPLATPRRERGTGELPPLAVHHHPGLADVARRAPALRGRRRRRADGVAPATAHAGPARRATLLRPRRAVRQRARHRLHTGRQPGVDQRAPRRRPPRRAAPADHVDRGHRRRSSGAHATARLSGRRRRRPSGAEHSPGWPRRWPPAAAARSP